MAFLSFLFGKKGKTSQYPRFEPRQIQSIERLLSGAQPLQRQATDFLSNLLDQSPEAMEQFQAPALRQFQEDIIPSIAERFAGMGSGNTRSSAFAEALGKAGAGLTERLSAQRAGLGLGAAQGGLGYLQNLLTFQQQPRFDYGTTASVPGLLTGPLQKGLGALAGGLGRGAAGALFG